MSDAIGALRSRITLQLPLRVADEIGGAAIAWSDQGEAWAEIAALGASERAAFDALPSTAVYRVTINRREDIGAGWRIIWSGRRLRITGIRDDDGARIQLNCEEEAP